MRLVAGVQVAHLLVPPSSKVSLTEDTCRHCRLLPLERVS